jgi:hypothetical protein
MDSYIEDRRQEGQLDSEGVFTVDALSALRKTLASALPEPHYYLLQIAQGLVAGGASGIEVAVGRHATRFRFRDAEGVFSDLEAARERLGKALTLSSPRPLDLLLTGMATAIGSEMDRADLTAAGERRSLQVSYQLAAVVDRPAAMEVEPTALLELHRTASMGLSFGWSRIWGARSEEEELQKRFEFAQPPLRIAGLAPTPGSFWSKQASGGAAPGEPGPFLTEVAVIEAEPPHHRGPELGLTRCPQRRAFTAAGEALKLDPEAAEWQRRRWTFMATSGAAQQAEVTWIRHGLVLETTSHELGLPGLRVLAPAEGLDVDASGYSLVRNHKLEARLRQARELVARTLGQA